MSLTDALKSEIFRPVAITMVPGIVSLTPFVFVVNYYNSSIFSPISSNKSLEIVTYAFLFSLVVAAGLILENIGSRIEVFYWKFISTPEHDILWREYLRSTVIKDCPAENYIRDLVLRMKFENSFSIALIFFSLGLTWLKLIDKISTSAYCHSAIIVLCIATYLLYESYDSVKLLSDVRKMAISKE